MKKNNKKNGFSLVEIIIAISVMVMVIVSATQLVVSIIRSNAGNINTLTAYGLSQEGLEAVRNIRDSNWLLGAKFEGEIKGESIWGDVFKDDTYYTVSIANLLRSQTPITSPAQLMDATPWKLEELSKINALNVDSSDTLLKKYIDDNSGEVQFNHSDTFASGDEDSVFHRYIYIKDISKEPSNEMTEIRVTSVVLWTEYGRDREVKLVTDLTNWNTGQL